MNPDYKYKHRYWVIVNNVGDSYPETTRETRQGSISAFMQEYLWGANWKHAYRRGFRCKKVTLVDGWKAVKDE